ncbi:MAG: WecB/TagA/CpsF family glycosyltransferase [Oscillospiraceae bacterium]|nr:WecB/TagA/CpsF family glycosyltransferase [Oscillospiraceae bacterium]
MDVLGVQIDAVTPSEALDVACRLMRSGSPRYVVTPNPEIIHAATADPQLRQSLNGADLSVADGIGVVRAAKKLGRPLPSRVPGVELAQGLLAYIAAEGKRLFLLGGKPLVAEKAAGELAKRHAGLNICGHCHGYFKEDTPIIEKIRLAAPDVIFVCLGSPLQELFMARNLRHVGSALMLGLGGAIDIFAGTKKRAPALFRGAGLEWLYRFATQPSRLARAGALPRFARAVNAQKKRERL